MNLYECLKRGDDILGLVSLIEKNKTQWIDDFGRTKTLTDSEIKKTVLKSLKYYLDMKNCMYGPESAQEYMGRFNFPDIGDFDNFFRCIILEGHNPKSVYEPRTIDYLKWKDETNPNIDDMTIKQIHDALVIFKRRLWASGFYDWWKKYSPDCQSALII